jgi:hypothetical protein
VLIEVKIFHALRLGWIDDSIVLPICEGLIPVRKLSHL